MAEPTVAQKAPYKVELEPKSYYWCSCGDSKKQPFCDGSHKTTEFVPLKFDVADKKDYYVCGCKNSNNKPFCDGSHTKLP